MKKQGKRWLSILLAGVLALLAPAAALAIQGDTAGEGSTEYIEVEACPGHLLGSVNGLPACVNAAGDLHVCENNFPDLNFKTILVRYLSWEKDYFPQSFLEILATMNVEIYSIRSLQGIGYFSNLKELNCAGNWLEKLDLSHNTKLERLRCQKNRLKSLDVSVLPNLTYLLCGENELTELNVSGNPKLETLYCEYNNLTELHVDQLPELREFSCSTNVITALDVSKNPALEELDCADNQLTQLDVSQNSKLTHLRCFNNRLASLDLSGNPGLAGSEIWTGQAISMPAGQFDGHWEADLSIYIPVERLEWVLSVSEGEYDPVTGRVSFDEKPDTFRYDIAMGCGDQRLEVYVTIIEAGTVAGLPACVTAAGGLHICDRNFPDQNFRNYLLRQSQGEDGVLQSEELREYTELGAGRLDIRSMEGIEYFYALQRLDCTENLLTELDISRNTKLTNLYCFENQLTTLDLSATPELKVLNCSGNRLTDLDVSGLSGLETLDFSGNEIQTIDIGQNQALSSLCCDNNRLSSLNLSGNPGLRQLSCAGNFLTELDLNHTPAISQLDCSGNQLTDLDVSGLSGLWIFYCENNQLSQLNIRDNTPTYLFCSGNWLTTLDVGENPRLRSLSCGDNQLEMLDVSGAQYLEWLDCSGNQLTDLYVGGNKKLAYLLCQDNRLSALDLSSNPALVEFNCQNNRLAFLDLRGNPNLTDCVLSTQAIRAESRQAGGCWEVDLSGYIPAEMRDQVLSVSAGSYDPAAGKAYFDTEPGAFQYVVATGRDGLDMAVDVSPERKLLPGDLDGSGQVDMEDVMTACKILARQNDGSQPVADEIARGDLTGDGNIQIDDIMAICKILAGQA